MFQVSFDGDKNRLYVTLEGHLEPAERMDAAKAFMEAIGHLRPGFDIINDMTGLHPTDANGLWDLARVQAAAKLKGLRAVVRVVKIPLSRVQLERASQETGWVFETASTLQEAEDILDALSRAAAQGAGKKVARPGS